MSARPAWSGPGYARCRTAAGPVSASTTASNAEPFGCGWLSVWSVAALVGCGGLGRAVLGCCRLSAWSVAAPVSVWPVCFGLCRRGRLSGLVSAGAGCWRRRGLSGEPRSRRRSRPRVVGPVVHRSASGDGAASSPDFGGRATPAPMPSALRVEADPATRRPALDPRVSLAAGRLRPRCHWRAASRLSSTWQCGAARRLGGAPAARRPGGPAPRRPGGPVVRRAGGPRGR